LQFQDDTITRVGANSIFSFEQGTRDLTLEQGTILLNVPKDAGGARVRTATVTAAVTGTTLLMEYFLNKWVKIIVLEGSLEAWIENNGERTKKTIKAGQLLVFKAGDQRIPNPIDIDLQRLVETSGLIDRDAFGPLPEFAEGEIRAAINRQNRLIGAGILVPIAKGSRGPDGGGPGKGSGGETPGERAADGRQIANDKAVSPPPQPREGDDPDN
jgi:hypothetical protein